MKRIYIGIDPDVNQSGVARVDKEMGKSKVWADHLPFPLLLDYLLTIKEVARLQNATLVVLVEASWKIGHNWHLKPSDSKAVAAAKGNAVGAMQQVGKLLVEFCQEKGIDVIEQIPLKKCWKGKDGKITHAEITSLCGWDRKRSNPEERDALLIAYNASGLPMRMKLLK